MFAVPRPKKGLGPAPSKKRKADSAVEEVTFDFDSRQEWLTGFSKRKQQRIKHAQNEAAKKEREEKLQMRKEAREDRRREVEEHVQTVNRMLRESGVVEADDEKTSDNEDDEWEGIADEPKFEEVDEEEEYIDEDRYTTVTVESVAVSRDGFEKPPKIGEEEDEAEDEDEKETDGSKQQDAKPERPKKPKKKKFRYESKVERQLTERKQRAKNRAKRPS